MCSLDAEIDFFIDSHLNATGGIQRSPKGLTYVSEWGSLRHAAGAAAMLAKLSRFVRSNPEYAAPDAALAIAQQQARLALVLSYPCTTRTRMW
jgi:hypothetical protein